MRSEDTIFKNCCSSLTKDRQIAEHSNILVEPRLRKDTTVKGTVARDFCSQLRLWGFRIGHTDVTHPLLTSVHSPFNLLRTFKEGTHRSKTDCILL